MRRAEELPRKKTFALQALALQLASAWSMLLSRTMICKGQLLAGKI
jgi:hypothetical protein